MSSKRKASGGTAFVPPIEGADEEMLAALPDLLKQVADGKYPRPECCRPALRITPYVPAAESAETEEPMAVDEQNSFGFDDVDKAPVKRAPTLQTPLKRKEKKVAQFGDVVQTISSATRPGAQPKRQGGGAAAKQH